MEVIVMRGIPGAGKDHWINGHIPVAQGVICSADSWRMKDGVYRYEKSKDREAHKQCFLKFLQFVQSPLSREALEYLVVNNTNSTAWEISRYYETALALELPVKILRVHCSPETGFRRNVHGVPPSTILRLYYNILTEKLPSHWTEEVILGEGGITRGDPA